MLVKPAGLNCPHSGIYPPHTGNKFTSWIQYQQRYIQWVFFKETASYSISVARQGDWRKVHHREKWKDTSCHVPAAHNKKSVQEKNTYNVNLSVLIYTFIPNTNTFK